LINKVYPINVSKVWIFSKNKMINKKESINKRYPICYQTIKVMDDKNVLFSG